LACGAEALRFGDRDEHFDSRGLIIH
jgi:hypothetical protein